MIISICLGILLFCAGVIFGITLISVVSYRRDRDDEN